MYAKNGDFESAFRHAGKAYEIASARGPEGSVETALAEVQMGDLHRQRGAFSQALAFYDQAIELHRSRPLDFSVHLYQAYRGRLSCLIAESKTEAAKQQLEVLFGVMDRYRAKIVEEENRNNFFDVEQTVYDQGIDLLYSQGHNSDQAFQYAEESRGRSLLDSMKGRVSALDRTGKIYMLVSAAARPLHLKEIQSRIPNDARLLQYSVLDDKLLIWVISRLDSEVVKVDVEQAALTSEVMEFQSSLLGSSDDELAASARLARELYGRLFARVEQKLGGSHLLYIIPDKVLSRLPWDALISPVTGRYLVHDYVITIDPSATIFARCTDQAMLNGGSRDERALSVGNPSFDSVAFPKLGELSGAEFEATTIAKLYKSAPGALLLGPDAREQTIREHLSRADIAHFALHCVVDEKSPMRSALVLAREVANNGEARDGLLEAYEIDGMDLHRTRLVVLSACQTGVGRYYRGEGTISMARAFLVAGVPLTVSTLWPVDSAATAKLMISFHEFRRAGQSTRDALQNAKIKLCNGPIERYHQPMYWAAFQLNGGYTDF
jgi:CHAT domain-containing protein